MIACCRGFASTGEHHKSCAMGRAASEAAPEYVSPIQSVMRQLTPEQRAKMNAQIEALIEAGKAAQMNALRGEIKPKDQP